MAEGNSLGDMMNIAQANTSTASAQKGANLQATQASTANTQSQTAATDIHSAMQLASAHDDLEQKKAQTEKMQADLNDQKFQSVLSRVQTQNSITDPVVQKQVAAQNEKQMQGITYPGFFTDLHKSPEMQEGLNAALGMIAGNPTSAEGKVAGLKAILDPTATHQMAEMYKNKQAQDAAAAVAGIRAQATEYSADKRLEGQKVLGGIRLDAREAAAVKELTTDTEVVPIQKSVQQAKKDYDLIQLARTDGLTPLKADELVQSYVGLLKGMSASSTGGERSELENAAKDAETRGASLLQKVKAQGTVHYKDEPFLQEIESSVRGLHSTLKDNLQQRLNEKIRKSGLESVNNAQQAAYNEIMQGSDLGFKPKAKAGAGMAPAAAGGGQQSLSATQQAYIAAKVKAGVSQADAQAKMLQLGIK